MSVQVSDIITNFNTYLGDTSNDRVTAAERLQYVTEAVVWLKESLQNDHDIRTYDLSYIDTIHYYEITSTLADLLEGASLRRVEGKNADPMTHKSAEELAQEISVGYIGDDSWAIERRDGDTFLVINARPENYSTLVDSMDAVGSWVVDSTTSDATNLTLDELVKYQGTGCINFDVDVSQSGNNKATITNSAVSFDWSDEEGKAVIVMDVGLPDVTEISSITFSWGNDSSNYWTTTVTTDMDGNPFSDGKNTLAFEWQDATQIGTVDSSDITYLNYTINYTASQADDTDFRIDNIRIAIPETLTFYYLTWVVGTDTTGATDRLAFSATTDRPYFSGRYDQYKYAVAHKAASLAFDNLRLGGEANKELALALDQLKRVKQIFPQSITSEVKSFKVRGINFNK